MIIEIFLICVVMVQNQGKRYTLGPLSPGVHGSCPIWSGRGEKMNRLEVRALPVGGFGFRRIGDKRNTTSF